MLQSPGECAALKALIISAGCESSLCQDQEQLTGGLLRFFLLDLPHYIHLLALIGRDVYLPALVVYDHRRRVPPQIAQRADGAHLTSLPSLRFFASIPRRFTSVNPSFGTFATD